MSKVLIFIALYCLALSACRIGAVDENDDSESIVAAVPPDAEVLAKIYDIAYSLPDGFYEDERADTPGSYSIYHVKDISVSYELCSDNYDEALAWEAADNSGRAINGDFVGSVENDSYFEFVRELSYPDSVGNISDLTSPGFARVFKCGYVNRDGVDRNLRDGYAGTINARPLTRDTIKTFAEYMWQFTFFWPARTKVLASISTEQENELRHSLVLAIVSIQGSGKCDLIEVVDWVFTADRFAGQVTKEFNLLYQFEARLVDGRPEKC